MIQMKLFAKQTHRHRRQMLPKGRGVRGGRRVWVRVRASVRVRARFRVRVRIRVRVRLRVVVRVRVHVRVMVVIKPIPLSRYPLARKGILFGGPAMEKSLDTRRR